MRINSRGCLHWSCCRLPVLAADASLAGPRRGRHCRLGTGMSRRTVWPLVAQARVKGWDRSPTLAQWAFTVAALRPGDRSTWPGCNLDTL